MTDPTIEEHKKAIKQFVKENYRIYQPDKVMYSFRIDRELIDSARKEASSLSISTASFIRKAIEEKIRNGDRLDKIEKRIERLEKSNEY